MAYLGRHAIVIGASMGGLLAARALADQYEEVTVLERDELPEAHEPRKGVPQGRHAHGLLARGREVLDRLFPGLSEEMVAQGAVYGDLVDNVRWFNHGVYLLNVPSAMLGCWSAAQCWRTACGADCCNFPTFVCWSTATPWSPCSIGLKAV